MPEILFITHPEVVIDPVVPVPDWGLAPVGVTRMEGFARGPRAAGVAAVWSSPERKARDTAAILARARRVMPKTDEALRENDRSATGFLPPDEFWPVVADFFAHPTRSVRGWERAIDAQARVLGALRRIDEAETAGGDVALCAHGGVGALLLAALSGRPISGDLGQPHAGGGCVLRIARGSHALIEGWRPIDA